MPLGELGKILDDAGSIRAEIVWAILVDKDARPVVLVLGIASNMIALLDYGAAGSELSGEPLSHDESGEASADDEKMLRHF